MSKEWTASDGRVVTVRPIRPTDLDLEAAFVKGLSRETGYQRLMSGRTPTPGELRQWTEIDPQRERALIAVTIVNGTEQQVGVARFVHDAQSGDAEFAIVLSDAWQGRGLGVELLCCLIAAAREFGVRRLVGTTLATNLGMIGLGRKLGFAIAADPEDASVENLTLDLSSDPSRNPAMRVARHAIQPRTAMLGWPDCANWDTGMDEPVLDLQAATLSPQKETVRVFYKELWDKADKSLIAKIFHADFTFRGSLGPTLIGHDQFAGYVDWVTSTFGQYTTDILAMIEEGNRVAGKMRFHGYHREKLFGIPPSGRHVWWIGMPVFTFDGTKVRDLFVLGDIHGLMSRLKGSADPLD